MIEGKKLAEMKNQRVIFQGGAQSPLLVVIAIMPLIHRLKKWTDGYKLGKSQQQQKKKEVSQFAKNEKVSETLTHEVRIYSLNIENKVSREKANMLTMRSEKRWMTKGIELQNPEEIRTLEEKDTHKYMRILEATPSNKRKVNIFLIISREQENYSKQHYMPEK